MLRHSLLDFLRLWQRLEFFRYHSIKLSFFDQLGYHINTAHEFFVYENLREGGPVGVHFQPLPDSLVFENIEALPIVVSCHVHKFAGEFTFWLFFNTLNETKVVRLS